MPGPSQGLGIGRFLRLSKDPLGFLTSLREHGTFVRYRLGPRTLHLVSDPEIVHEVLIAKASAFHKDRGTEMMRPLLGRGLLTSEDEQHRRQRRALQPAFHKSRIADYARVMAEEALLARDALAGDEEVDLFSLAMRTTFAIVGRALFGARVAGEAAGVQRALADAMSVPRLPPAASVAPSFDAPVCTRPRRARGRGGPDRPRARRLRLLFARRGSGPVRR